MDWKNENYSKSELERRQKQYIQEMMEMLAKARRQAQNNEVSKEEKSAAAPQSKLSVTPSESSVVEEKKIVSKPQPAASEMASALPESPVVEEKKIVSKPQPAAPEIASALPESTVVEEKKIVPKPQTAAPETASTLQKQTDLLPEIVAKKDDKTDKKNVAETSEKIDEIAEQAKVSEIIAQNNLSESAAEKTADKEEVFGNITETEDVVQKAKNVNEKVTEKPADFTADKTEKISEEAAEIEALIEDENWQENESADCEFNCKMGENAKNIEDKIRQQIKDENITGFEVLTSEQLEKKECTPQKNEPQNLPNQSPIKQSDSQIPPNFNGYIERHNNSICPKCGRKR